MYAYLRAEKDPASLYAAVTLIGNPHKEYVVGDLLNPKDIHWEMVPACCSMCAHPYNGPIKSLTQRCHILRGKPPCAAILHVIANPDPARWFEQPVESYQIAEHGE